MRTATKYVAFITSLIVAMFVFLFFFNIWQFGAGNMVRSTCGTLADRVIPGWRSDVYPQHIKTWVPGEGGVIKYSVSAEERLAILEELDGHFVGTHNEL